MNDLALLSRNSIDRSGDMAPLKSYVVSRMMRDPTDDPDAIMAEFAFSYYGSSAAPWVLRVIDTLTAALRTCPGGHKNPLCECAALHCTAALCFPKMSNPRWLFSAKQPRWPNKPRYLCIDDCLLCAAVGRIVDWTHISRHNHAMDPGDDGEYPKPWLNASVILDCLDLWEKAVASTPNASKYRARVDVAKLPTYFALLYLWAPTRAYAKERSWPVEATATGAFDEFARVFAGIPSPSGGDPDTRKLNENGLTLPIMKQEVLNRTNTMSDSTANLKTDDDIDDDRARGPSSSTCQIVNRVECGHFGISQADCEGRGCCFHDSAAPSKSTRTLFAHAFAASNTPPVCFYKGEGVAIKKVIMIQSNHFDAGCE